MLFSSNPSYLLYLDRTSANLYDKSGLITQESITPDMMQYLEVLDLNELTAMLSAIFTKIGAQNQAIVALLGDDIVFRVVSQLTSGTDAQLEQDKLSSKIPFAAQDRSILTLTKDDKTVVFGANKQLITALQNATKTTRNKLTTVTPASAYGLRDSSHLTTETINQILHNKAHVERINFLTTVDGGRGE